MSGFFVVQGKGFMTMKKYETGSVSVDQHLSHSIYNGIICLL